MYMKDKQCEQAEGHGISRASEGGRADFRSEWGIGRWEETVGEVRVISLGSGGEFLGVIERRY